MVKFKNIALKDLGLVVQFATGVLDMPPRKGETLYDWGDEFEALVNADDIYFGSREITLYCFFDDRKGFRFPEISQQLREVTTIETLETDYGNYQVKFNELKEVKSYKGGKTLQLKFIEVNPDLSGTLPTSSGESYIKIDGLDLFVHFGLLVENVKLFEVPQLKTSKETTYKSNKLSIYREPQELNVKVNGIYASKAEMTTKINQLNACLAKEGLRHFVYKDDGFQCFAPDGHKVTVIKNRVEINFKWKVMAYYNIEELVQMVVDRVVIGASPQSDLAVTDTLDPAFIKNKDTFMAADSYKLNGKDGDFYANMDDLEKKQDKMTSDGSLYVDGNIVRNNVSTYSQVLTKVDSSQIFELDFTPTYILLIHNQSTLMPLDFTFIPPNKIEIIPSLSLNEKIQIIYDHFIKLP